jgi:hypothetical protein
MKKIFLSPFFVPTAFIVCWGTLLAVVLTFFPDIKFKITEDGEIIEFVTNIGYLLMAATMLYFAEDYKDKMRSWGVYLFLGICAFLRECGIQHTLSRTDSTPFKTRFFLNPNNPLSEKIMFGLLLLIIFGALGYLAVKYAKHLIVSFFKLDTVTWSTAVLCTTLVIAKFTDRFPGNWRKVHNGIALPREQIEIWSLLEESSEMFLPYLVVLIFLQYHLILKERQNI